METKYAFQLRCLGVGFLPEAWARPAIEAGLLVEKEVVEPKPDETFYLAWRSGEEGAALGWWLNRVRAQSPFERLITRHCHEAHGPEYRAGAQAGLAK
jgi:DNA-binding transcriptional LysR family regulator